MVVIIKESCNLTRVGCQLKYASKSNLGIEREESSLGEVRLVLCTVTEFMSQNLMNSKIDV